MSDKIRSKFEAFKSRYGGGFLNDAADDNDKLLHTVALDAWQAATLAESLRCVLTCEDQASKARSDYKTSNVPGVRYSPFTDGKAAGAYDCADAIRLGGEA